MKKKLPFIIGLILTVLFALWYGYRDVTHLTYDNNVNTAAYSDMGILHEGDVLEQSFVSKEDRIDGFLVKTNAYGDHANVILDLSLVDAQTGDIVGSSEVSGADVKARKLQRFGIEPLSGCMGREYSIILTETGSSDVNGVSFYCQPDKGSGHEGVFLVNGSENNGTLVMKTVTRRFDTESFIVMLISVWFIWGFLWFLSRLFK